MATGGVLRKGMSVRMKKNIVACQPFKDGVSTIICSGCHALMAFPTGSARVRCTACQTVTTGIKVPCTSCKKALRLPIRLADAQCPHCGYRFQPVATFRLALPGGQEVKQVQAIVETAAREKANPHTIISLTLCPTGNLQSPHAEVTVKVDADRSLNANFVGWSTKLELPENATFIVTSMEGEVYDSAKTPVQVGVSDGDMLTLTRERTTQQKGSHRFKAHQFMTPTSCAQCKKFIWGVYKQGKICSRCRIPVHHRCAERVTEVCEVAVRESCGLSLEDFGADDPGSECECPDGFPVDEQDMEDWGMVHRETDQHSRDSWLRSFDKLSDWTDEEIAEIWKKYDSDKNGYMDKQELRCFLADLVGSEGGRFSDAQMDSEVTRVLARMDTNGNGIIEWEEFWYFHQAQRASRFLAQFRGVDLSEAQVRELWEHYDADGSGELDTDEVRALLRDCVSLAGTTKVVELTDEGCGFWQVGELVTWDKFKDLFLPVITTSVLFDEEEG
eukprot:TRINITY_DN40441_c0_g1_i1.p1 TRINITY_DN40441_c0_g1~~TRINITY_DN40441_c0_g1_i1.p1  ORF type:complete len:502 (+),score=135.14 TRINITY_DN40441_c0_g1_i1:99-1604(+)